ncbi:Type IV pilus biogenesis protein PilN [hydrothermal vent metagenome]|uniref:Type IV pilus biogenesis protein PilN n=1 Tax=hydrothermal vent metagenome TaxID=652676 RepID=A0A3B0UYU7_9ZZZZ
MIRINLLPVRAAKKKESLRFQLTVGGLIIFLVLSITIAVTLKVSSDVSMMKEDLEASRRELVQLKRKVGKLSKIKEQKRIVQSKLDVVSRLEAARKGPTLLFAKISSVIPERAWLSSMRDQGRVVTLSGVAAAEEDIAAFMRGLQDFKDFNRVDLVVAQTADGRIAGRNSMKFTIQVFKLD